METTAIFDNTKIPEKKLPHAPRSTAKSEKLAIPTTMVTAGGNALPFRLSGSASRAGATKFVLFEGYVVLTWQDSLGNRIRNILGI